VQRKRCRHQDGVQISRAGRRRNSSMLPPSQSGVPAGGRSFSKLEIHARQLFDPYKDL
jgi:hypothetical protein